VQKLVTKQSSPPDSWGGKEGGGDHKQKSKRTGSRKRGGGASTKVVAYEQSLTEGASLCKTRNAIQIADEGGFGEGGTKKKGMFLKGKVTYPSKKGNRTTPKEGKKIALRGNFPCIRGSKETLILLEGEKPFDN